MKRLPAYLWTSFSNSSMLRCQLILLIGLSGIGWGIEYLIQQGFIEGNADEILEEIDLYVVRAIYLQEMNDLGLDRGVLGLGRYILMRIRSHWKTGDTYSSLELKENLIYLIDWLGQRLDEMGDETGEL